MGLDMYLSGRMYLSEYNQKEKAIKDKLKALFPDLKLEVKSVVFDIFYWRKANAIHKWFVDNVQSGEDDCRTYDVSWDHLHKLLETINKVLGATPKDIVANEITGKFNTQFLPTEGGFFFGETAYDEYYFKDLKDTKQMLEKIFKNEELYKGIDFEYRASW